MIFLGQLIQDHCAWAATNKNVVTNRGKNKIFIRTSKGHKVVWKIGSKSNTQLTSIDPSLIFFRNVAMFRFANVG